MADENAAAVAEPPAAAPEGDRPLTISLGEITDAMDKAFPSTAPKPGAAEVDVPPAKTEEPAAKVEPEPAKTDLTPAKEDDVPDSVFGDREQKADAPAAAEPQVDVPPSIKEPKAIENWKQLRSAYDETKATVAKQATEIAELRKKADLGVADEALKARLAVVEQQLKAAQERVRSADIQDDEGFQQHFIVGRKQSVSAAANIAKRAGIEPSLVESALSLSGDQQISALDEITGGIQSETLKQLFAAEVSKISALDSQKAAVLADSQGSWERLQEQRKAESYRQMQEQETRMKGLFQGAVKYLRDDKGFEVLKKVEGDDNHWWNKQADETVRLAEEFLLKTTDQNQIALMPLLAATSGTHRGLWLKERQLRIAAQKELADIKGAEPGLNGRQPADTTGDETLPANISFAEAAARRSGLR